MNYYEHHIGDFLKKTAHLSLLEEGVYRRLLDRYYITEGPLPADLRECCRLARASSKAERQAVADVLNEFFDLRDDGWHQNRADEEIARYQAKVPDLEAKKKGDRERQQRARDRRKQLFDALRGHGIVPPWDTTTAQLQDALSRVTEAAVTPPVTEPVTCDNTATQTPLPRHQTPDTKGKEREGEKRSPTGSRIPPGFPTEAEIAWCKAERPSLDPDEVAAKFRDYWVGVSGQRGRKVDWPATWRNFVRSEWTRSPPARASPTRQDRISATVAELTGRTRHQSEVIDVDVTERTA